MCHCAYSLDGALKAKQNPMLSLSVIGKAVDVNRDYEDRKGSGGSWGTVDAHFLTFLTLAKINLSLVISFRFQVSSHCH